MKEGQLHVDRKLDCRARSVPDARAIAEEHFGGVELALDASVHNPADPMGKLCFNILATFSKFEAELSRTRTRECMAVARAKGKLKGKKPKLPECRRIEWRRYDTGGYAISDLAELFAVSRPTVYNVLKRVPEALIRADERQANQERAFPSPR